MSESENGNGAQYLSRKWKLVLLVVILATLGAFLPPLVSAWLFGAEKPLVILSGTEWVSVVTLSVSAYFGANVWQKHVEKRRQLDIEASGVQGGDDENVSEDEEDDANKEA
jgi:predicted Na+-dependent transporter